MKSNKKCLKCLEGKEESELVKLACDHIFCWVCMNKYLESKLNIIIKCPINICKEFIRDSVIRSVLSEEIINIYDKLCISGVVTTHKCLLYGCMGSFIYTDTDIQYSCRYCTLYNCISCDAAHNFTTCEQYQSMNSFEKNNICQTEMERAEIVLNSRKREDNIENLKALEEIDLMKNDKIFTCELCLTIIGKGEGVKLRHCSHEWCKSCICKHIDETLVIPITCPKTNCKSNFSDREIQTILSAEELKSYHNKCNTFSKKNFRNVVHCKTPNCESFYDFTVLPENFTCRTCKNLNCIKCEDIHTNESCELYQAKKDNDKTSIFIEEEISNNKLMRCTACHAILDKIRGCNWVQCKKCNLELCWILKIPRWGPKGRGDNSGGCRCGVNGVRCDIRCTSSCIPH